MTPVSINGVVLLVVAAIYVVVLGFL